MPVHRNIKLIAAWAHLRHLALCQAHSLKLDPSPYIPRWDLNPSTLLPQACCSLDMYHNLHLLCVIRAVMQQTALHPALPSVALERNLRFMVTERPDQ